MINYVSDANLIDNGDQIPPRPETNYDHGPYVNGQALFNEQIVQGLESHNATNGEV